MWRLGITMLCILISSFYSKAQLSELRYEQLEIFAQVSIAIDSIRDQFELEANRLVKAEPLMEKGHKFNDIKKASVEQSFLDDKVRFDENELMAYNEVMGRIEELKLGFKEAYITLIRSKLGFSEYNYIKGRIRSDSSILDLYNQMVESIKNDES